MATIKDMLDKEAYNRASIAEGLAGAPYSLNPQRILLPNGRTEYAPLNLRSDEQKERQHMLIYGADKEFPLSMGKEIPPGKGGSPGQPYQPPQPTGPYVPPPNRNMMIAEFPRLSTGEPMTNIEQQQGLKLLEQLPKSQRRKQLKVFMDQYMKGV